MHICRKKDTCEKSWNAYLLIETFKIAYILRFYVIVMLKKRIVQNFKVFFESFLFFLIFLWTLSESNPKMLSQFSEKHLCE